MNGKMIVIMGVTCLILAVLVFSVSIIYQKTTGKRIMEELEKEYLM